MNIVVEYRVKNGLTQKELADELSQFFPGVDRSLISKMETGLCEPSPLMREHLEKACAHPVGERKINYRVIGQLSGKDAEIVDLSPAHQLALEALKEASKEAPLTRSDLRNRLHTSDRGARRILMDLRAMGVRVIGNSSSKGYWLASTEAEYKAFRRDYVSRAATIYKNVKAMDAWTEGQMRMNGQGK